MMQDLEDIKSKLQASWNLFNDCMKATLTIQQLEGPATPAKLITQPCAREFWEKYFQTVSPPPPEQLTLLAVFFEQPTFLLSQERDVQWSEFLSACAVPTPPHHSPFYLLYHN
jgi:hypothetical protein